MKKLYYRHWTKRSPSIVYYQPLHNGFPSLILGCWGGGVVKHNSKFRQALKQVPTDLKRETNDASFLLQLPKPVRCILLCPPHRRHAWPARITIHTFSRLQSHSEMEGWNDNEMQIRKCIKYPIISCCDVSAPSIQGPCRDNPIFRVLKRKQH